MSKKSMSNVVVAMLVALSLAATVVAAPLDDAEYLYQFNPGSTPRSNLGTDGAKGNLVWNTGGNVDDAPGDAGFYQTTGSGNRYDDADVFSQQNNDSWGVYSSNDYLKTTDTTAGNFTGDFTVFMRHLGYNSGVFVLGKGGNDFESVPGYALQREETAYKFYSFPYTEADALVISGVAISPYSGYDVTFTFTASTQTLSGYIHRYDGTLVNSGSKTISHSTHSNSAPLEIGAWQVSPTPDAGGIEMLAMWDRALSPTEVESLTIPEPATVTLLCVCGLGLLRRRR